MKLDVIKSRTEPTNTNKLWLSPEGLKEYKSSGWEAISGSNSGSGSGGGDVVLYECARAGYKGPMTTVGKDIFADDQTRRTNNINHYNILRSIVDTLYDDPKLNDLDIIKTFNKYVMINFYPQFTENFDDLMSAGGVFRLSLGVYEETRIKNENGESVNCFIYSNIYAGAYYLALCEDGTVFTFAVG